MQNIWSIPKLTREYWRLGRAALTEHADCLTRKDLIKYYYPWLTSVLFHLDPIAYARPWITFGATRFLSSLISKQSRVFEFGAGGSTTFLAYRVGELVTVEHDRAWLERTVAKLNYQPGAVWQGLLEEPVALVQPVALPPTDPDAYASTGTQFAGMSFQRYATSIERYDDNYFDVVLIDGRARPSCFKHAVPKTKIGGYIVLDNAEREEYAFIERAAHLSGFEITEFWGPGPFNRYFWRTIFVRKTNRDARRPAGPRAEVPQSATEHATATCSLSVATSATTAPAPIVQA